MLFLRGVVAHIDFRAKLHFLDLDLALILARLLGFDGLFVLVLAIIHDATYRRFGVRGNFHQIKSRIVGNALSLGHHIDAHLLSIVANQAALTRRDLLINPWFLSCY